MNRSMLTLCCSTLFLSHAICGTLWAAEVSGDCAQRPFMRVAAASQYAPPPSPAGFWRNPHLSEKLALSQDQVKSLRDIDFSFLDKAMKLHFELDQLQLRHERYAAEKNEAEAQGAIDKIAKLHSDLFKLHAETKTTAAQALSPEQMIVLEANPDPLALPKGINP